MSSQSEKIQLAISPTMSSVVATHGMAVPDRPHAISVHINTWQEVCAIALGDNKAIESLKNGYPRSYMHQSIQAVSAPNMMQRALLTNPIAC